jgi:hypothetical protein
MYDEVPQGSMRMKTMIIEFKDQAHSFVIKNATTLEP